MRRDRIPLRLALPLLLAACTAGPSPAAPPHPPERIERRLSLMGTSLDIAVDAVDRATALAASEKAVAALEAAEARLSTWRIDSELARLNQAPAGEPVELSEQLAAELTTIRHWWKETGGAFDPGVGALIRAWGLREGGRRPSGDELRAAMTAGGLQRLRLDGRTAVRERAGMLVEEGAWGKGAGLADALAALAETPGVERATLDLGGQVAVFSRDGDRGVRPWKVPVADPRQRDRAVVALTIDRGSVSTSGNSERGIVVEGRHLGHILDPRSGRPAADFGSLTVWAADPLTADCLSTGLYVMGPEGALAWAASHPGIEVVVLRLREGKLEALATPHLDGKIEVLADDVSIRFKRS